MSNNERWRCEKYEQRLNQVEAEFSVMFPEKKNETEPENICFKGKFSYTSL